jgi:ubiquitin-protein ligase
MLTWIHPAFTVRYEENNTREIQAVILGPPGTPYELGFYEVRLCSLGNWM